MLKRLLLLLLVCASSVCGAANTYNTLDSETASIVGGTIRGIATGVSTVGGAVDGTTDDASVISAACSIPNYTVRLARGTYRIASNITCLASVVMDFSGGGILSPDTGIVVTINGPIIAPPTRIFSGLGTIALASISTPASVKWWGSTCNGAADDTATLNAAFTSIAAGSTLTFPDSNICMTSTGITATIKSGLRITSQSGTATGDRLNLNHSGTSGALLALANTSHVVIENIGLSYSNASYTGDLITLSDGAHTVSFITFRNVRVGGVSNSIAGANSLIRLNDATHTVLIEGNSKFTAAVHAIYSAASSSIQANRVIINGNYFDSNITGASIVPAGSNWVIENNSMEAFSSPTPGPCQMIAPTAVGVSGLVIKGNWIGDAAGFTGTCIDLTSAPTPTSTVGNVGVVIEGNRFGGISDTAIKLGNTRGAVVAGNQFNSTTVAIDVGTMYAGGDGGSLSGSLFVGGNGFTNSVTTTVSTWTPTINSSCGTSPSVVAGSNYWRAFSVDVGTGGTATACVINMPKALASWQCNIYNSTAQTANRANQRTVQFGASSVSVTIQNQLVSTGAAQAWAANDILKLQCQPI